MRWPRSPRRTDIRRERGGPLGGFICVRGAVLVAAVAFLTGGCAAGGGGSGDPRTMSRLALDTLGPRVAYAVITAQFPVQTPGGARLVMQDAQVAAPVLSADGLLLVPLHLQADRVQDMRIWIGSREYRGRLVTQDERAQLSVVRIRPAAPLSPIEFPDPAPAPEVGDWVVSLTPTGPGNDYRVYPFAGWVRGVVADQFDQLVVDGYQRGVVLDGAPFVDAGGKWLGLAHGGRVVLARDLRARVRQMLAKAQGDGETDVEGAGDAWIGVNYQPINPDYADAAGLSRSGLWLTNVVGDSPAGRAGLRAGDVVLAVDGAPLALEGQAATGYFMKLIAPEPGRSVLLDYVRDGARQSARVTFEERPKPKEYRATDLGIQVREVVESEVFQQNLFRTDGVVVIEVVPGSAAASAGDDDRLRPRDVIVSVNRRPVTDLATFTASVDEIRRAGTSLVLLEVWNGNTSRFVGIDLRLGQRDEEGGR